METKPVGRPNEKKLSPNMGSKLTEALERTRRFAEGTSIKEIKETANSSDSKFGSHTHPIKPFIKRIKDYLREVNERIARARNK